MKITKNAHKDNTKYGKGDSYGTGVRNKVGRMIEDSMSYGNVEKSKLKNKKFPLA